MNERTVHVLNEVEIQQKIERINNQIKKRREKYELIVENLKKGFDPTIGKEINNKYEIERRIREERDKYYNYKERKLSEIVDIENGIDEEIIDEEPKQEKEVKPYKRNMRQRVLKNIGAIAAGTIIGAMLIGGTYGITTYINHENEIDRKTAKYEQELKDVVDNAEYTRIGNLVYQNGEVVEVLDEESVADHEYQYIVHSEIANYIENSDNPDLAVFTLYRNYGMNYTPEYNKIVRKTFKSLEFDGSVDDSIDNFDKYLESNGYSNYSEYYKTTRKELLRDGDSELDNIKVKVKKMTR